MVIDTHCHLDFKDFDEDRDVVIDRARAEGVGRIINVASSVEGTRRAIALAGQYDMVYATLGVHPHEAAVVTDEVIADFKALAKNEKVVAVGEVGLDYHRLLRRPSGPPRNDERDKKEQAATFRKFIELAQELDLPLIIHSRDADDDVINILKEYEQRTTPNHSLRSGSGHAHDARRINGVMHCFSGDAAFLKKCLDLGLYVSFTCNLTFKNAKALREVAAAAPAERLLLETDAPFLAPQVFRGKRNEPAYLKYLVEEWSRILMLSKDDIARITTHNANRLFRLGLDEETAVAYEIRDSLYLNITNRCTNRCDFCVRNKTDFVKGHRLKLASEPSVGEIIKAAGDPEKFREVVFCGYGEPTIRLDAVKAVSKELKAKGARIRLVTNGHGDLINKRPIAGELAGLVGKISVSLNVDSAAKYNAVCRPDFGPGTFEAVLIFTKSCSAKGIETEVTCLDLPGVDIKKCEEMARGLGAGFRIRKIGTVG
jgi:TatD DNase family protein